MEVMALQVGVALVGLGIALVGAWGLRSPRTMSDAMTRWLHRGSGLLFAVAGRTLIGVLFIYAADHTRFPAFFLIVGALSLIGAATLLCLGRERMVALVRLITRWGDAGMRAWLGLGILTGLFVAYGTGLAG